jgi:hypothetical protein
MGTVPALVACGFRGDGDQRSELRMIGITVAVWSSGTGWLINANPAIAGIPAFTGKPYEAARNRYRQSCLHIFVSRR